jgi:hypothetical protein
MQFIVYIFWILVGALLAFIFIKCQQWSVSIINPDYPKFSKWLIVGGALIRWLSIAITFIFALRYSITMMFFTFGAFVLVRILILFRWQSLINKNNKQMI